MEGIGRSDISLVLPLPDNDDLPKTTREGKMFEHQVLKIKDSDPDKLRRTLNGVGEIGWELVAVTESEGFWYTLFLKRRIED